MIVFMWLKLIFSQFLQAIFGTESYDVSYKCGIIFKNNLNLFEIYALIIEKDKWHYAIKFATESFICLIIKFTFDWG